MKRIDRNYSTNKRTKTKDKLYRALIELMLNKNAWEISVTELVDHAGLSRGTFYYNYKTTENLINEVLRDVAEEIFDAIHQKAPYATHYDFWNNVLTILQENQAIFKNFDNSDLIDLLVDWLIEVFQTELSVNNNFYLQNTRSIIHGLGVATVKWTFNPSSIPLEEFANRMAPLTEVIVENDPLFLMQD